MKNPTILILIFLVLAILFIILFFTTGTKVTNSNLNNMENEKNISLNMPFEMSEGETVTLENMTLKYDSMFFPPESYTGDPEEYTYPNFTAIQNGDELGFALSSSFNSQYYHQYLIKLLKREDRKITLEIEKLPPSDKISEDVAVKKALEIAVEQNIPQPKAKVRILKKNVWQIEIRPGMPAEVSLTVEIDAQTGEVIDFQRQVHG